jgi:ATP-dependent Clp protease adaptor protein ClpS
MSESIVEAIKAAADEAARRRHRLITVEHLLRGLLREVQARDLLGKCGAELDELERELDDYLDLLEPAKNAPRPQVDANVDVLLRRQDLYLTNGMSSGVGRLLDEIFRFSTLYASMLLRSAGPSGIDLIDLRRVISHGSRAYVVAVPPGPRLAVRLHNDDFTTMEFVVAVLVELFGIPLERATERMMEIHQSPQSRVEGVTIDELMAKDAIRRVSIVHDRAAQKDYPLRCSLHPVLPVAAP